MRWIWLAPLLVLLAGCQGAQLPDLGRCITEQAAAANLKAPSLEQVNELRGICYDILSDQQRIRRLQATARIYEDQIFQNHIMLYMVVFITLGGVFLAGLQLWASYKLAVAGKGTLAEGGGVNLQPGNIAVKSSVVGVIILGISLAFFMVFVTEVYKISPIPEGPRSAPSPGPAAPPAAAQDQPPPNMKEIPR